MKRCVYWTAGGTRKEIKPHEAVFGLRPADVLLVSSRSAIADLIDIGTRPDPNVPFDCPRVTHAEMVKRLDTERGPIVVSTEWVPGKPSGLIDKEASRQFQSGKTGVVFRHPSFRDADVAAQLVSVLARKQADVTEYDFIGAMLSSDMVRNWLLWIPQVRQAAIYQTRAQHCSRTIAEILIEMAVRCSGRGIDPFKPGDQQPTLIDPRELWAVLVRAMYEASGWDKIMEWAL